MTFEPRFILGQFVEIKSVITPQYNGAYKIVGINHQGVISPAEPGDLITTLQLYIGQETAGGFKIIKSR